MPRPGNGGDRANHIAPTVYYAAPPPKNCPGKVFMLVTGRGDQRLTLEEAQALAKDLFKALDQEYRGTQAIVEGV